MNKAGKYRNLHITIGIWGSTSNATRDIFKIFGIIIFIHVDSQETRFLETNGVEYYTFLNTYIESTNTAFYIIYVAVKA